MVSHYFAVRCVSTETWYIHKNRTAVLSVKQQACQCRINTADADVCCSVDKRRAARNRLVSSPRPVSIGSHLFLSATLSPTSVKNVHCKLAVSSVWCYIAELLSVFAVTCREKQYLAVFACHLQMRFIEFVIRDVTQSTLQGRWRSSCHQSGNFRNSIILSNFPTCEAPVSWESTNWGGGGGALLGQLS